MKRVLLFLLVSQWIELGSFGAHRDSTTVAPTELRLHAQKASYSVDDPIVLRIEIHNRGSQDCFVGHLLAPIVNAPSYVVLTIEDSHGRKYPETEVDAELGDPAVWNWWVRLPPLQYVGAEMTLDKGTHDFLAKPGLYRIKATYTSRGGATPSNPEYRIQSQRVWAGRLTSNEIQIRVLPR